MKKDLSRRLQSVVFSPLAIVNCWYMKSPPWRQLNRARNNAGEVMPDAEAVEARCHEIVGWRMSLLPYLRCAMEQYAEDGTPPFRALVLDYPHDTRLHKVDDQFLVGDRLMVAPLFAGEEERNVVIPAGEDWHDFWTGESVKAGTSVVVHRSAERIPVYIKANSLMPWAAVAQHTGAKETRHLTLRVYGTGERRVILPGKVNISWADGKSVMSGRGEYLVSKSERFPR